MSTAERIKSVCEMVIVLLPSACRYAMQKLSVFPPFHLVLDHVFVGYTFFELHRRFLTNQGKRSTYRELVVIAVSAKYQP